MKLHKYFHVSLKGADYSFCIHCDYVDTSKTCDNIYINFHLGDEIICSIKSDLVDDILLNSNGNYICIFCDNNFIVPFPEVL